jgi:hypothetical protein
VKRSEWIFPVALLALLLVAYGVVPLPTTREGFDSFAVDGGGKKAFYDLTTRLLPGVQRSAGALIPADPEADTLVLLGPSRYPDRAQWETLHDWVSEGRSLVFAAKWDDPAVSLGPFGIEIVPALELEDEGEEPAEPAGETGETPPPALVTELAAGVFDWRTEGQVRAESEQAVVELSWNGTPQVVWQPVGDGVIVAAASDFVFSNLSLTKGDNGVLAFRILESASPFGPVYFDEELNESGAQKVVGLLLEPPFRLPTLQLLIVALLFCWMASRRFGPLVTPKRAERRSLVEHAEALGSLHFRAGTASPLLAAYLEHFRGDLDPKRRRAEIRKPDPDARGGDLLAHAQRAAKSRNLDRARTASILSSLARLRADSRRKAG